MLNDIKLVKFINNILIEECITDNTHTFVRDQMEKYPYTLIDQVKKPILRGTKSRKQF